MKRCHFGLIVATVFLGGAGWYFFSQTPELLPHEETIARANPTSSPSPTQSIAESVKAPCGNVAYALRKLDEAHGDAVSFFFLLETPSAADELLRVYPTLTPLSKGERVLTCSVPQEIARKWLEQGLFCQGILGFDAEMPVELYGKKATEDCFVGTASLQQISTLDGRGEVVAVIDSGISTGEASTFHPELLPALYGMTVEPSVSSAKTATPHDNANNSHGTHVAGCIVAQQKHYQDVRGTAPGAALYFQRFIDNITFNDISQHFTRSQEVGASIVNCSWGHSTSPTKNNYNGYSRIVDQFVWDNPEMLLCFAAGNDGCDLNGDNVVDLESIYSGEAYAKNVIVVGAQESYRPTYSYVVSENNFKGSLLRSDWLAKPSDGNSEHHGMFASSSRGPLSDGRIAPMLVAPGTAIYSTLKDGSVGDLCGTSMASPIVAGAAAVLRQYLREVQKIERPTAALMRAGLILASKTLSPGQFGTGATREIPEESPNNVEGWGALRLGELLRCGEQSTPETLFFKDRISLAKTGDEVTFKIDNAIFGTSLTVVLSWIDAPATSGTTANVLQNDYDLILISPEGESISLNDHTNPIERITVNTGYDFEPWTIKVRANKIVKNGSGNLAAIAWRVATIDSPVPLPKPTTETQKVSITVSLPEGHRPYLDYPVWPAPGTHQVPIGETIRFRGGRKLPRTNTASTALAGWLIKLQEGTRTCGKEDVFSRRIDAAQEVRWYESLPGAGLYLR